MGTGLFSVARNSREETGEVSMENKNGTIVGENSFQAGYDMTMNFIAHELVSIPFLLGLAGYIKGKMMVDASLLIMLFGSLVLENSLVFFSQVPYLESHTVNGYVSVAIFMAIALHTWMKNL